MPAPGAASGGAPPAGGPGRARRPGCSTKVAPGWPPRGRKSSRRGYEAAPGPLPAAAAVADERSRIVATRLASRERPPPPADSASVEFPCKKNRSI